MDPTLWVQFVRDVGFPIVLCGAGAYAAWSTAKWIGGNLVIPIRDRFFGLLDDFKTSINKLSDNLDSQTDSFREQTHLLGKITDGQERIEQRVIRHGEQIAGIHRRLGIVPEDRNGETG